MSIVMTIEGKEESLGSSGASSLEISKREKKW
jgi:hypothetical protein